MEMTVDHIVPERYLNDTNQFAEVRRENGLPDDFNINDYGNWLLSCHSCNGQKGSVLFPPLILIRLFQNAETKAEKARLLAKEGPRFVAVDKQFAALLRTYERGEITEHDLILMLRTVGLNIRTAADRLGVRLEGTGEPATLERQRDGSLLIHKGTLSNIIPHNLVSDLCRSANTQGSKIRIPEGLMCAPVSPEETDDYILRLRACFMSALIRDSNNVIAYSVIDPHRWPEHRASLESEDGKVYREEIDEFRLRHGYDDPTGAVLFDQVEAWEVWKHGQRFFTDLCQADRDREEPAMQAIDCAIMIISDMMSWDADWIDSVTGEAGQYLSINALASALETLFLWWYADHQKNDRPWRCLSYRANRNDKKRCRSFAVSGSVFCRHHQPEALPSAHFD